MGHPVTDYALASRDRSIKNRSKVVFFTKSDIGAIIEKHRANESQLAAALTAGLSHRRRWGAGRGSSSQAQGARTFSTKFIKGFHVDKTADGQDILLRRVKHNKQWRWCAVLPVEDLVATFTVHHERSVGYGGINKLYGHVRIGE